MFRGAFAVELRTGVEFTTESDTTPLWVGDLRRRGKEDDPHPFFLATSVFWSECPSSNCQPLSMSCLIEKKGLGEGGRFPASGIWRTFERFRPVH